MAAPLNGAIELDVRAYDTPRRRYLTILFSDLSDSTRIASSLEAEDYCALLERVTGVYHEIVAKHGGTVAQISGDGMLALFGYPDSREGDGRRAVEAALDLRDTIRSLGDDGSWKGAPLMLHSGIHAGLVLLHSGDACRGRFEILGCATNVASRLCAAAGAGQILVSEASLGPERHLFETSARSRLRLRGAGDPVTTLAITARAATHRGEPTPFIGREAELVALGRRLGEAAAGDPRFVAIEGPPGVGKTRLADEFLRRIGSQYRIHRGECDASAEPLQPFLQIALSILGLARPLHGEAASASLADALAAIDPALVGTGPALLRLLAPGSKRDLSRAAVALGALIERSAARGPLVLFIDDWQFADDASREVVTALRVAGRGTLLVLATARPDPLSGGRVDGFEAVDLGPFTSAETRAAVTRLLPAPDPFTIEEIRSASGGNPLFIEELCHSMAAYGDARVQSGSPWLATLIESRVARLPAEQAAMVRVAAVIGANIPSWLFETITGHGEHDPRVLALAAQDFLFPGERPGTLRFKHGITREVIYESVGLHERRRLHATIASALRAHAAAHGEEEPLEALAYHYGAAGIPASAADYAERAGDKALAASALDRAQAHYRAALAALDLLPPSNESNYRWARIAQRFGRAGVCDPSRDQLPIFERALEKAQLRGDRAAYAWAGYWLGYINYGLGEPKTAIAHWQRSLEAATAVHDERLEAEVRAALGQGLAAACDYRAALPLLDAAIESSGRQRLRNGPPTGLAYALSCKGFALGDMGRFDEARDCFDRAMAAIRGAAHEIEVSVLNQCSVVCTWQGRFEEALPLALEGAAVAERVRSRYSHAMSRSIAAFARWSVAGGGDDSIDALVEATDSLDLYGRGQFTSLNHGWLAEMMAARGRYREALRYAGRAMLRARKSDRLGEAMALRAAARVAAAAGLRHSPGHYLDRAERAAAARGSPHELAATGRCRADLTSASGEARPACPDPDAAPADLAAAG